MGVILTVGCSVIVATGIAGSGSVAETLFQLNAKYFYYTEKYRYRTLKDNVLVITSEQSKLYTYSDKKHTNYTGLTTYSLSEY